MLVLDEKNEDEGMDEEVVNVAVNSVLAYKCQKL